MQSQHILVLAPHPDDETFGCGGTLRLLANAGARIDVAFMTRGELGVEAPEAASEPSQDELAQTRSREAQTACDILGVRAVYFLDGSDGKVAEQSLLSHSILNLLRSAPYRRVFCPWPQEKHPDHAATFSHLREALRQHSASIDVWLYEVWTPMIPNMFMPIDGVIEQKIAAMQAHQSQLACLDYVAAFQGLAAYRALFCPPSKYAEAFFIADRAALGLS